MIPKVLAFALMLMLLVSSTTFAQTTTATPQTVEQLKSQKELEQKALSLLDDVIKDSESFKHAENRIRLRMMAANVLWKHDENRARLLFRESMAGLIDLLKEQAAADPEEARKVFEGPGQLRGEMLQVLAQRDARLARELLRATRANSPQPGNAPGVEFYELQMDLNLAVQIAASDPNLASEIAQESLAKGLDSQLLRVLAAIKDKDPEVATHLASDIMSKLRTEKLDANGNARGFALGLLQMAAASADPQEKNKAKSTTPLLDQSTLRELTEMIAAEALRSPTQNADILYMLQSMMPVVEKYAPTRAAQIRQKAPQKSVEEGEEGEEASEESMSVTEYQTMFADSNADDLLAAAAKAPPGQRDVMYRMAAMKMMEKGDVEHARQIANDKIQDPNQRKQLLSELDQAAAVAAAEQGKIDQARKVLATLRTNEERVMLLSQLAIGAAEKGEKKIALQLLEETRGMIGQRAKNINQLGAQLMVARAYARLDPSRSLSILEPIVDQLNELLGAATVLGGFFVEELVKDDEIMLGPISMFFNFASNEFLNQYVGDITTLARADFDRTKALVERFQRDEIRAMMRLLLAQSILSPPAPSSTNGVTVSDKVSGIMIIGAPVGGVVLERETP